MFVSVILSCLLTYIVFGEPTQASSPLIGHLTSQDILQLKNFFQRNLPDGLKDPSKTFYLTLGLNALGDKIKDEKGACSALTVPLASADIAFHHVFGVKILGLSNCKISINELKELSKKKLVGTPTIEDLFHTVMALKQAELEVDTTMVTNMIDKIKSKDPSPSTMGMIFQLVSKLKLSKSALKPYMAAVATVLSQADELSGNQLFYDRGLYTTALVAQGVSDLVVAYGEMSDISEDKIVKLLNFIHSRIQSNNLRAAAYLISALKSWATNPYVYPLVLSSNGRPAFAGDLHAGQPQVQLKLTDLLGNPISEKVTLKAGGLFEIREPSKVLTLVGPADRGVFTDTGSSNYNLALKSSSADSTLPPRGNYVLDASAQWAKTTEKRKLLGVAGVQLPLRILVDAQVTDAVITLSDATSERHISDIRLQPGQKYRSSSSDGSISLDMGHQLSLKLRLVDSVDSKVKLTAHQVFVQMTHSQTEQAITFVLDEVAAIGIADAKAYKLHLDPEQSAAEFDHLSGIYKMELIIGDPLLRKPILWHLADVSLQFHGEAGSDTNRRAAEATDVSRQKVPSSAAMKRATGSNALIGDGPTKAKNQIEHVFRPPERRAPRPLAWAFTFACVVPLFGLLVAWLIIGINVRNFSFRLSNFIFHAGLIGIFCLYYVYWCRLDMFTTLGYLAVLGVPTFLAGNCVLRAQLAARHAISGGKK